jgi:signal transduction histidine kinase
MTYTPSDYTRRLELLLEVCLNLSANLDLDELLNAIVEASSGLTASESSAILVLDRDTVSLRFAAVPEKAGKRLIGKTIPINQSVAGTVYRTGQPVVLNNTAGDKRVYWPLESLGSKKIHSLFEVPMIFKGKTVGVLAIVNKLNGDEYCEADMLILATLAAQAAAAFENHRLLDASRQAYQKVIELDRMKSDFIAIASHELRTPLGVILGHATFLQDSANKEQAEDLDIIVKNSMRLKEIVEEFANVDHFEHGLSRLHRGKLAINQIAQEVVNSFRELSIERKINLIMQGPKSPLMIEGDAAKIAMALREVVKNALTFTNPAGQVKVEVDQIPGFARIAVMDSGIGIPADEQAKIFQRFYQVEKHLTRRHGGMGLGLSIARDMVDMHGGSITVESVEGKGSRFTLLLPIAVNPTKVSENVFIT